MTARQQNGQTNNRSAGQFDVDWLDPLSNQSTTHLRVTFGRLLSVRPVCAKGYAQVGQSALYPSLHKLEQNGWIRSEWAISENNRKAKYYTLTRAGRKALEKETTQRERLSAAVSQVVRA